MSLRKDIAAIKEKVGKIDEITLKKAIELDNIKLLIKDIKIKAIPKVVFDPPTHNFKVHIDFEIPPVELYLDDNNEETESPMLRALNLTKLLPLSDSTAIANKLAEAKERNRNNGVE